MPETHVATVTIRECDPDEAGGLERSVNVTISQLQDGTLLLKPEGYGNNYADIPDAPIIVEMHGGKLKLHVFTRFDSDDAKIINLEKARCQTN